MSASQQAFHWRIEFRFTRLFERAVQIGFPKNSDYRFAIFTAPRRSTFCIRARMLRQQ
jgi:hypothetical protein